MATAAVFMVRQRDFKRLLAYSSVEHMGILIFGIGIGGTAIFGVLLHVINNAMTKGVLFLSAGNIHRAYRQQVDQRRPRRIGRAALVERRCCWPAFSPAAVRRRSAPSSASSRSSPRRFTAADTWSAALFLLLLLIVFIGMGTTILSVVFGKPSITPAETPFPTACSPAAHAVVHGPGAVARRLPAAPSASMLNEGAAFLGTSR